MSLAVRHFPVLTNQIKEKNMDPQVQPANLQPAPQKDSDDALVEPLELVQRANEAVMNLDWDAERKFAVKAQEKAKALQGPHAEFIRRFTDALLAMNEGQAIQFRDNDAKRFERALGRFEETRTRLEELRAAFPDKTDKMDYRVLQATVDLQSIWARQSIAREAGDEQQAKICDAQIDALIEGRPPDEKKELEFLAALRRFQVLMRQIRESVSALADMNLDRAMSLAALIRKEGEAALAKVRPKLAAGVLFMKAEQVLSGGLRYVEALEAYATALHHAIVGGVTRAEVDQLARAETLLHDSSQQMADGIVVLRKLSAEDGKRIEAGFQPAIGLVRNLRALCNESLQVKSWAPWASIKFVVFFLTTAIALAFTIGAANGAGSGVLTGYSLLVSFIVALIGGFGFEALRFLPFARILTKSLQSQQPANDSAEG
jgi:hypothetical protein